MLSNKLVIFLMGPTASGKTNFAIEIAKKYSVRIISVDSAMIYKGMDIGTAKPDKRTLVKFPHYLVDIVAPNEIYSASSFISDATEQINLAFENDQIPILVGGTSFYFKALENGLSSGGWSLQASLNNKLDAAVIYVGVTDRDKNELCT